MTIVEAVKLGREQYRTVRRAAWPSEFTGGIWAIGTHLLHKPFALQWVTHPWAPTVEDLLAEDWGIH